VSDGFFTADLAAGIAPGDPVELTGLEARHAGVVRRLAVGESVTVTNGQGLGVIGHVTAVAKSAVGLVADSVIAVPVSDWRVTVAQAVPKPERAELAVDLMTEVGVDEILPWAAARSQTRWSGERGEKARSKWTSAIREASKQSRRLRFPELGPYSTVNEVAERIRQADCAIVMHEAATRPISTCPVPDRGQIVIVIGPEGGLTDDEVRVFGQAGAAAWSMGSTVLRTSTAGAVAVAQVRLLAELSRSAETP